MNTLPFGHSRPPSGSGSPNTHGWLDPQLHGRPAHTGLRLSSSALAPAQFVRLADPLLSVDLEQHAPRIQDQGPLRSCVGHTVARALAICIARQGLTAFLPSPLDLYRGARLAIGTEEEDSGAMIADALAYARTQGFAPDSLWPHESNRAGFNLPPPVALDRARPHHRLITSEPLDYDLDTLRWELACGFPVCVGIRTYAGIVDAPGGVIPLPQGSARGGHAMCVSGFDNARQALRIDNSWSAEGWGEKGRGWLPFEYVLNPLWCGEIHSVRVVRAG